jgi:alpha-1,3-glucosyltransferase
VTATMTKSGARERRCTPATKGVFSAVLLCLALRVFVGVWPHSGQGAPPLHGDFEAQRHWMELSAELPVSLWYAYDLPYWGLDYPPLTALHSLVLGKLGVLVAPASFAFESSRGAEDAVTKQFMRWSVVASDLLTYVLPVVLFALLQDKEQTVRSSLLWGLLQPGLILIDHGHFQFNCVCLGLVTQAALLVTHGHELLGSACFVLALNFKHMALYFAPCFFAYLLGKNVSTANLSHSVRRVAQIGAVVVAVFALLWLPLFAAGSAGAALGRLFPVGRGIFEDKVANFWCAMGPLFRFKERFSAIVLFRGAAVLTLGAMAPSCVLLCRSPTPRMLLLSLANVSLASFLFAFQVHEKSVLMPLLPVTLLASRHPVFATWFSTIACFSMFPLLERDGLSVVYAVAICGLAFFGSWTHWSRLATLLPVLACHVLMAAVAPPAHLPHLWIMACMFISFVHSVVAFATLLWLQWFNPE